MSGAIHPLLQYAFMAWCLVKSTGITLPFLLFSYYCILNRFLMMLHKDESYVLYNAPSRSAVKIVKSDRTCSSDVRDKKCIQYFGEETA
jgi:hypothetical protein